VLGWPPHDGNPPSRTTPGPRGNANGNAQGGTDTGGSAPAPDGAPGAPRGDWLAAARVRPAAAGGPRRGPVDRPGRALTKAGRLRRADALAAATHLELIPAEFDAAWRVAVATRMLVLIPGQHGPGQNGPGQQGTSRQGPGQPGGNPGRGRGPARPARLRDPADDVLAAWDEALTVMLEAEDLDGMATALLHRGWPGADGCPVRRVPRRGRHPAPGSPRQRARPRRGTSRWTPVCSRTRGAALSVALEMLADLGVVELGADEPGVDEDGGALTVTPGAARRVGRATAGCAHKGWHVPVNRRPCAGADAAALLATLANCDVEDGEAEIASWLAGRNPPAGRRWS